MRRFQLNPVESFATPLGLPPRDLQAGVVEWMIDGELADREAIGEGGRLRHPEGVNLVSARIALGERGRRRFAWMWGRKDREPTEDQLKLVAARVDEWLDSQG